MIAGFNPRSFLRKRRVHIINSWIYPEIEDINIKWWNYPFKVKEKKLQTQIQTALDKVGMQKRPHLSVEEINFINGGGLNEFEDALKEKIIGQPDIIEELISMRENQLLVDSETPHRPTFMGMPSTGRKTAVRAFVNLL